MGTDRDANSDIEIPIIRCSTQMVKEYIWSHLKLQDQASLI